METDDKILGLVAGSRLMGLLSALLAETPGRCDLASIGSECETVMEIFDILGNPVPGLPELLKKVKAVSALTGISEAYTGTFGHIPAGTRSPYETSYAGPNAFAQSQTLADIAGFYKAFGVKASLDYGERPDHLGVELEFLALLNHKEALALDGGNTEAASICRGARKRFVEEHIGKWAPVLFDRIEKESPADLYRAVGALGKMAMNREIESLGARCLAPDITNPPPATKAEDYAPELFECSAAAGPDQDYELY